MSKHGLVVFAMAGSLPFAALAQEMQMPRLLQGMAKGQWKMEMLENSAAKPGQKFPTMTICSDNFARDMRQQREKSAQRDKECKHRIVRDGANDAVMEIACPKRTVTTTMKRENAKSMLLDISTTGERPQTMKMRYTNLGPCREGQSTFSYDKAAPGSPK